MTALAVTSPSFKKVSISSFESSHASERQRFRSARAVLIDPHHMHFITASDGKSVLGATPEVTRKRQHVRGVTHQFDVSCGSRSQAVSTPIGWKDGHGNALSTGPSFGHGVGLSTSSRQDPIGATPHPHNELYLLPKHVLVSKVPTARHSQIHFSRQKG